MFCKLYKVENMDNRSDFALNCKNIQNQWSVVNHFYLLYKIQLLFYGIFMFQRNNFKINIILM